VLEMEGGGRGSDRNAGHWHCVSRFDALRAGKDVLREKDAHRLKIEEGPPIVKAGARENDDLPGGNAAAPANTICRRSAHTWIPGKRARSRWRDVGGMETLSFAARPNRCVESCFESGLGSDYLGPCLKWRDYIRNNITIPAPNSISAAGRLTNLSARIDVCTLCIGKRFPSRRGGAGGVITKGREGPGRTPPTAAEGSSDPANSRRRGPWPPSTGRGWSSVRTRRLVDDRGPYGILSREGSDQPTIVQAERAIMTLDPRKESSTALRSRKRPHGVCADRAPLGAGVHRGISRTLKKRSCVGQVSEENAM